MKTIVLRVCLLLVLVGMPGFFLGRLYEKRELEREAAAEAQARRAEQSLERAQLPSSSAIRSKPGASAGSVPPAGVGQSESTESGDPSKAPKPLKPTPAMLVSSEVGKLRALYARGGMRGITDAAMEELRDLVESPEGRVALLAEIDREENGHFLAGIMHGLASNSLQMGDALIDPVLADGLWERFLNTGDEVKQEALLSFFAREPRLRAEHLDDFLALAAGSVTQASQSVRLRAISALRSCTNDKQVQAQLISIAESSDVPKCRAAAVFALSGVRSSESRALVESSLTDPSEAVRNAAVSIYRPAETAEGQRKWQERLEREVNSSQGRVYKCTLIDRLLDASPSRALRVVKSQVAKEKSPAGQAYFNAILTMLTEGNAGAREIRAQTNALKYRYQFNWNK